MTHHCARPCGPMIQWRAMAGLLTALLTVGCFGLHGCKRSEKSADGAKTIGVTLLTVQHQFYQDLRAGLEEEAKKYGYRLLISTAEFDPVRQANQIDEFIDYATLNIWPRNWGWFNPTKPETYAEAERKARQYFLQHAKEALALGKPLVLEEFGPARD